MLKDVKVNKWCRVKILQGTKDVTSQIVKYVNPEEVELDGIEPTIPRLPASCFPC